MIGVSVECIVQETLGFIAFRYNIDKDRTELL